MLYLFAFFTIRLECEGVMKEVSYGDAINEQFDTLLSNTTVTCLDINTGTMLEEDVQCVGVSLLRRPHQSSSAVQLQQNDCD